MISAQVDLYEYMGLPRPEGARGLLLCCCPEGPEFPGSRRSRPAVLILPGGGYHHTSTREAEGVALRFAARGWAAFVLHYSVRPLTFPVSLREAAMAMLYIRRNAHRFGVNPHMVAAVGFSAGGHLCGTLGTLYDGPELSDLGSAGELRPDALGLCYPVAVSWGHTHQESFQNLAPDNPGLQQRLSLDKLVRPDMPPVFLWHTRDDGSVPVRNSLILASALEEAGVDFAMHIYRHGPHGLSTADESAYPNGKVPEISRDIPKWPEKMIQFFEEIGFYITDSEETV